jgi:glycerol-3-phosphate dehydrogenase
MLAAARRRQTLTRLRQERFDALVVGGGAVGVGIARDLALRGFRVVLVEQQDLASGTSSRPTRLIHGGLRYLEQFDFGLVRSDMREREILLRVAPHLVLPLPFLMPMYGKGAVERARLRAGMQLYDVLSYDKSLPSRRWLDRAQVLTIEPSINADELQGAWRFYDAQVALVERLVVETALDAAAEGALILNHARVLRFARSREGRVIGAEVHDGPSGESIVARAAITINATGPWLDVSSADLRPGSPSLLRLTKGVHLVTPSGTRQANVLFAGSDGRLIFVVPWLSYSLVGTTDTDYEGDPALAAATEQDVDYLVGEAKRAFPGGPFDHVYYTWAGVRALVRENNVAEGEVSRKHSVLDHEREAGLPGIISVLGGKLTAYRGIAEQVGDLVVQKLGRQAPGYSSRRSLPGGRLSSVDAYLQDELRPWALQLGLDDATAKHLGRVYGSLAADVLRLVERQPELAARACPEHPTLLAELARSVDHEWALTLADVLLRRTTLGLDARQGLDCLEHLAAAVGAFLSWDAVEQREQVAAYRATIEPMRRFSSVAVVA